MRTECLIAIWDTLLRLFHSTLVAAFALSFATGDDWSRVHSFAGYTEGTWSAL